MKRLMLFEDFVNESTGASFVDSILTALNPTILQITERIKASIAKAHKEEFDEEKEFTVWEIEMIKVGLILDMLKSFQRYILDTDKLVSVIPSEGSKGIEIKAVIDRDGVEHTYNTTAIYAGGVNIQRLHLRYLVNTTLPKIKSDLAKEYEIKYKNLSKAEKINKQIADWNERIKKAKVTLIWAQSLTDKEKLDYRVEHNGHELVTWQDIIDRDASRNFNNSEEEFNEFMQDANQKQIKFFNAYHIDGSEMTIKNGEKELEKLQIKMQKLI